MVTEGQYLDALKVVRDYIKQIQQEIESKPYEGVFLNSKVMEHPEIVVRTYNSLRAGVHYDGYDFDRLTFGDLQKIGSRNLRKYRGIGKKSIKEICKIFENNNERFK